MKKDPNITFHRTKMSHKDYVKAVKEWKDSEDEDGDHEMMHPDCLKVIEHGSFHVYDEYECKQLNIPIENEIARCDISLIDLRRLGSQLGLICQCPDCKPTNLQAKIDDLERRYSELIMAVEEKFSNETRHETALRYIKASGNSNLIENAETKKNEHEANY